MGLSTAPFLKGDGKEEGGERAAICLRLPVLAESLFLFVLRAVCVAQTRCREFRVSRPLGEPRVFIDPGLTPPWLADVVVRNLPADVM